MPKLVQSTDKQVRQSAYARKMPTVFIQCAVAPREQAKELGAALRAAGYNVPPEDRESAAANQREFRFFHEADSKAADELVDAVNKALSDLNYSDLKIKKADATKYRGTKPRPGVLELWIELPRLSSGA
jgi:hypothetical protein